MILGEKLHEKAILSRYFYLRKNGGRSLKRKLSSFPTEEGEMFIKRHNF